MRCLPAVLLVPGVAGGTGVGCGCQRFVPLPPVGEQIRFQKARDWGTWSCPIPAGHPCPRCATGLGRCWPWQEVAGWVPLGSGGHSGTRDLGCNPGNVTVGETSKQPGASVHAGTLLWDETGSSRRSSGSCQGMLVVGQGQHAAALSDPKELSSHCMGRKAQNPCPGDSPSLAPSRSRPSEAAVQQGSGRGAAGRAVSSTGGAGRAQRGLLAWPIPTGDCEVPRPGAALCHCSPGTASAPCSQSLGDVRCQGGRAATRGFGAGWWDCDGSKARSPGSSSSSVFPLPCRTEAQCGASPRAACLRALTAALVGGKRLRMRMLQAMGRALSPRRGCRPAHGHPCMLQPLPAA